VTVNTWIVVAGDPAIGNLIETARALGGQVSAAVVGPRAVADTIAAGGVDQVVWLGELGQAPVEAYASAVAEAVGAAEGAVLGASRPGDRVLLGAVAARLQATVLTEASSVSIGDDALVVTRTVFGGIAEETVVVAGPVALVLDGGPVPAAIAGTATSGAAPVVEFAAIPLGITVVETNVSAVEEVDLGAAARVIGIGRGLKAQGDLAMIDALAGASKAEVGCSRPVAEGLNWLGKDRYIGVSGQRIVPELYIAIGISGQLQHMVGVRGAATIVAINSDPNALVFKDADYCLVGDLYQIVPALTEALK
jgi:electron transfer flavoprotein alpha subunit